MGGGHGARRLNGVWGGCTFIGRKHVNGFELDIRSLEY